MSALSDYIRNLAVFLLFSSFITIITPGKKFERYINLVLGIILIFILIAPLSGVINALAGSSGDIFADISLAYDRSAMASQIQMADEAGQQAILDLFTDGLTQQTQRLVDNHGHFYLEQVNFTIDTTDNFGDVLAIHLTLRGRGASAPFLRIDPIRIAPAIGTRGEPAPASSEAVESPHIMSLKTLLSGFYNLAEDNIILQTTD
ncbi:MAG: stage III sporulation protein AF [Defluviitaleaceae bacterium]|nr:stage III sporulation protein AF [Defluviitaleaceae bacterium]